MESATMNVFQTYKALSLKNMWKKDLEQLNKEKEKINYKLCLPWKNFLGLSIELAILINLFLLVVGIIEYGILATPFIILIGVLISLKPLASILIPIALFNIIKVQYNKMKNKNNPDLVELQQKDKAIQTNLETLENGLKNHSIVPETYQSEIELNQMMVNIKNGKVVNDYHAVNLHAHQMKIKQLKEMEKKEKLQQRQVNKEKQVKGYLKNFIIFSLLIRMFKKA